MNQNFSGAVLLLILAAAGFHTNTPAAWWFAGITAALAFIAEEVRSGYDMTTAPWLWTARNVIALLSWLTVAASAYSLL